MSVPLVEGLSIIESIRAESFHPFAYELSDGCFRGTFMPEMPCISDCMKAKHRRGPLGNSVCPSPQLMLGDEEIFFTVDS